MRRSIHFRRRNSGFTVIELAVSLAVMVFVMLGMLALFDFSNRLSHVQTNVADMQQSQRIAQQDLMRTIRMLGRGPIALGEPASGVLGEPASGIALTVLDQVPEDTHISGDDSPLVLPETDIVTVRGVFESPVYQVNALAPDSFDIEPDGDGYKGHVDVSNLSPTSIPQDLQSLKVSSATERLVLINAQDLDRWSIVVLTGVEDNGNSVRLKFASLPEDIDVAHFALPAGDDLDDLESVAFVGILEEHRFYIRQDNKIAPNGTVDLAPVFSRARVIPGTDTPWRTNADWEIDVADNIVDLQVALGYDTSRGGSGDSLFESENGDDDDWLYNSDQAFNVGDWTGSRLYFVRLTTLARTDRRDSGYQSPPLDHLENHDLTTSQFNGRTDRMFRYRPLQTFIDMRNVN